MASVTVINPNTSHATTAAMVAIASRHLASVSGWTALIGPEVITTPEELDAAALAVRSYRPEVRPDGLILAAFGDPGHAGLVADLGLPTVGIGAAAAAAAAKAGRRFAVATTTPRLGARISALMGAHAPPALYCGAFFTAGDPLALMRDPGALDAALTLACLQAIDAGAEAVIIGGGPLAEAAQRIGDTVPVPLIEPVPEAARALARLLGATDA